jgi:L-aminopeptidase/D-esterase-like protein
VQAITDVPEVLVGHTTLIYDEPRVARTGVTVILPRRGDIWLDNAPAAYHAFNGCGEMTGLAWIEESGALHSPIGITNTHQSRPCVMRWACMLRITATPINSPCRLRQRPTTAG